MIIDKEYKVSAFGEFSDIQPDSKNMMFLLGELSDYNFIPTLTNEVNFVASLDGSSAPRQNMVQRIAFVSQDNSEQVLIGTNRIDYTISSDKLGVFSADEIENYNEKIFHVFNVVFGKFNKKASRLALNTQSFLVELNDEEIANIEKSFPNPIALYQKSLDEWNAHYMVREKIKIDNIEKINVITNISKVFITREDDVKMPAFSVQLDINSLGENIIQRFTVKSMEVFISEANKLWKDVVAQIG